MVEPQLLFAHMLAQTRQNVELLVAHKQISEADGEEILSRLPVNAGRRHSDESSSVVSLTQQTQGLSVSPAPPKVEARAVWEWSSEDPNDLTFEAGDIIEVIAETNADWWTGRDRSGRQGLFPSNYVETLPPRSWSPILVPEPRKAVMPAPPRYSSPALPHPSPNALPHVYDAPPPAQLPPPPPPGPLAPQLVAQQAPAKKNKFGGLGQVMAQSAASGAGFGAGAAIGSGIVNSIL